MRVLEVREPPEIVQFALPHRSLHPDAGEMIDDHPRLRIGRAHPPHVRQRSGVREEAHDEPLVRGARPHLLHAGGLAPGVGLFLVAINAEAAHPSSRQRLHGLADVRFRFIHDRHAAERLPMRGDGVEQVAIIKLVKAHLNEQHTMHALRTALGEELLRRKARRHVVLVPNREALRERIAMDVRRPDVDMRIDKIAALSHGVAHPAEARAARAVERRKARREKKGWGVHEEWKCLFHTDATEAILCCLARHTPIASSAWRAIHSFDHSTDSSFMPHSGVQ